MSFAVKLDENLSLAHVSLLRQAGYDADRVDEQGLSGATDAQVWKRVCADNRLFITLDLDFSDIRKYQPGTHPGILLIRARTRSTSAVADVLTRVAAERSLANLRAAFPLPISPSREFAVHLPCRPDAVFGRYARPPVAISARGSDPIAFRHRIN